MEYLVLGAGSPPSSFPCGVWGSCNEVTWYCACFREALSVSDFRSAVLRPCATMGRAAQSRTHDRVALAEVPLYGVVEY